MEPTAAGRPETTIDCDDETLFARYQRDGDKAAFEMLYERRTPDLRQFVKRQWGGGTVAEVEVIVQETFRDLHQCLESVTGEIPIRRLLHKIAKCRLRDAIRHASRGKRDYHRTQRLDADTTFSDTGRKVVRNSSTPSRTRRCWTGRLKSKMRWASFHRRRKRRCGWWNLRATPIRRPQQ